MAQSSYQYRLLNTGMILLILLSATLIVFLFFNTENQLKSIDKESSKLQLMHALSKTASDRGNVVLHMHAEQDIFERDALLMIFNNNAKTHILAREKLIDGGFLSKEELIQMSQAKEKSFNVSYAMNQTAQALAENDQDALRYLTPEIRAEHRRAMENFQHFTDKQNEVVISKLNEMNHEITNGTLVISVLLLAMLVSIGFVIRSEARLIQERNLLEQTVYERTQELQELAYKDPLTGLANRRHLQQQLHKEFERSRRNNVMFSYLMFDIDHFKQVNDHYGHALGDEVLRVIGQELPHMLRSIDVAGRIGGEEFAIIMPNTPIEGALEFAERLRSHIAASLISNKENESQSIRITISIGVTTLTEQDKSAENYIDRLSSRADKALYQAKNEGRNCLRSA